MNNVYKNTKSYDVSSKSQVDPSYWIYQNQKIFEHYDKHTFNYYVEENFPTPEEWKKIPNLKIIPLTDLEKNIIIETMRTLTTSTLFKYSAVITGEKYE